MESLTAKSVCFDCFSEETQLFVRLNRVVDEVVELKKLQYIHDVRNDKENFLQNYPTYSCIQLYTALYGCRWDWQNMQIDHFFLHFRYGVSGCWYYLVFNLDDLFDITE